MHVCSGGCNKGGGAEKQQRSSNFWRRAISESGAALISLIITETCRPPTKASGGRRCGDTLELWLQTSDRAELGKKKHKKRKGKKRTKPSQKEGGDPLKSSPFSNPKPRRIYYQTGNITKTRGTDDNAKNVIRRTKESNRY